MPDFTARVIKKPKQPDFNLMEIQLPTRKGITYYYVYIKGTDPKDPDSWDVTSHLIYNGRILMSSSMGAGQDIAGANGVTAMLSPGQIPERETAPFFFLDEMIKIFRTEKIERIVEVRAKDYNSFLLGCDKLEELRPKLKGSVRSFFEKYRTLLEAHMLLQ
jgi:hypothetical protein